MAKTNYKKNFRDEENEAAEVHSAVSAVDVETVSEKVLEPIEKVYVVVKATNGLRLRKDANTDAEEITVLQDGTKMEKLGEKEGFTNVSGDGFTGWAMTKFLENL